MGMELTVKLILFLFWNEKYPPLALKNENNPKITIIYLWFPHFQYIFPFSYQPNIYHGLTELFLTYPKVEFWKSPS